MRRGELSSYKIRQRLKRSLKVFTVDKSIKYVPVQLCPKCNGDGNVFTNYIHGSSSITSSGTVTCNLCNGTMVIPQQQVS